MTAIVVDQTVFTNARIVLADQVIEGALETVGGVITRLTDRGEIALRKRADLVQVRLEDGVPIVRTVWRQGRRFLL